jgi:hypothetical protein
VCSSIQLALKNASFLIEKRPCLPAMLLAPEVGFEPSPQWRHLPQLPLFFLFSREARQELKVKSNVLPQAIRILKSITFH